MGVRDQPPTSESEYMQPHTHTVTFFGERGGSRVELGRTSSVRREIGKNRRGRESEQNGEGAEGQSGRGNVRNVERTRDASEHSFPPNRPCVARGRELGRGREIPG